MENTVRYGTITILLDDIDSNSIFYKNYKPMEKESREYLNKLCKTEGEATKDCIIFFKKYGKFV